MLNSNMETKFELNLKKKKIFDVSSARDTDVERVICCSFKLRQSN